LPKARTEPSGGGPPCDAARAAGLRLDQKTTFSAYDALAHAAVSGDPDAFAVIDQAAAYLSVSVTSMVNLLDLERLVLTGPGMAIAGSIYARRIRDHLSRTAHARHRHDVLVELSAQPRDAAGIGAAALVVQASIAPGHTAGLSLSTAS
jgi:predicted NBD/HSP70 family sugar kinase